MFCANCGSQQEDNNHNCTSCGQTLHGDAPQQMDYATLGPKPSTYLVPSILVTIFCCQIFGIIAIIYSAIAMGKVSSNDFVAAREAASKAKMWCWLGFGIGFVIMIIYIGFIILGAAAGAAGSTP